MLRPHRTTASQISARTQIVLPRLEQNFFVLPEASIGEANATGLPAWSETRVWPLASPEGLYPSDASITRLEIAPEGGSDAPEPQRHVESVLFTTEGFLEIIIAGQTHILEPQSFVYIPPATRWSLRNAGDIDLSLYWVRKPHIPAVTEDMPQPLVMTVDPTEADSAFTEFLKTGDMRHDMAINLLDVSADLPPMRQTAYATPTSYMVVDGALIAEIDGERMSLSAGDYLWLGAYCPHRFGFNSRTSARLLCYHQRNRHFHFG